MNSTLGVIEVNERSWGAISEASACDLQLSDNLDIRIGPKFHSRSPLFKKNQKRATSS